MKKPSKKNVVAVLAGVTVATAVAASAASLGGLTTQWLGANSNVVSSPVTGGVNVTWDTAYDASLGYYVVTDFTLDTIDDAETLPTGADVQLTLQLADSDTEEFEGTVTSDGTVDLGTVPAIAAHDVEGVSVVIAGGGADSADRP
ncbi:hypothetical protein [Pseudactinotalea sp.]|uniref:hypothetical protein n=1 Tax=Pseudactinotalea sp. TaxID=1926260 RepID=UPI003B3ADCFB